jgi:hypothetical protein
MHRLVLTPEQLLDTGTPRTRLDDLPTTIESSLHTNNDPANRSGVQKKSKKL